MVYLAIKGLVEYGLKTGLIKERDRVYATNQILDVMKMDEYEEPEEIPDYDSLEDILKELLDAAHGSGVLEDDSIVYRDLFDTRLMNCLMPRPSEVADTFWKHYKNSPKEATDYYYKLSQDSDYIRRYRVCKDMKWKTTTPYGDLDITTISDKPKERQEIATSIISASRYEDMLDYIGREVRAGKQAYFVCSKIDEDDEEGTLISVKELFEELRTRLPFVRFALLHGKMKDKEKSEIMQAFKDGKYDCLVSTTVIEVGVDVPNATIMVIYNAERFGLSQLHQLRGRVGRGSEKSYCFLLMGAESDTARERLLTLKNNTDGFKIAEKDLEMRGSGDFFGTRQSGKMLNEIRNLQYPANVIFAAKKMSDEAFEGHYDTEELREAALRKYNSLKDVVLN